MSHNPIIAKTTIDTLINVQSVLDVVKELQSEQQFNPENPDMNHFVSTAIIIECASAALSYEIENLGEKGECL